MRAACARQPALRPRNFMACRGFVSLRSRPSVKQSALYLHHSKGETYARRSGAFRNGP